MAETMSDAPRATRPGLSPAMRHALIGAARIALGVATVVIVWQAIITLYAVPAFIAPTPGAVVVAFVSHIWDIIPAIAWTLRSVLLGMGIALVLAVILAGIFTLSPLVSRALLPLIIMLRTAPVLAIAPILILIFGRGLATSIAVVVLVSFFPIMVNAAKGFGSTPPPNIASRIMLPSMMPNPYCSFHLSVMSGSEACPRLSELFCNRSFIS